MALTKKMTSVLLSFVLAVAMIPSVAFADEGGMEKIPDGSVVLGEAQDQVMVGKARTSDESYVTCVASIPNEGYLYTGKAITPVVTVVIEDTGEKLLKNEDYTVEYYDNVARGYATILITFMGEFSGTMELEFAIGTFYNDSYGRFFGLEEDGQMYCLFWAEDGYDYLLATISGKDYCFDVDGYCGTGWMLLNGYRYYFNKTYGHMLKGVNKIGSYRYYFNPDNGRLRTGLWTVSGKTYYFRPGTSPKGKAASGWMTINGKTYYFNKTTNAANKGIWKVNGKKYYFNSKGHRQTGWWTVGGKKYYFRPGTNPKGQAYSTAGVRTIGGKKYYFYKNGHCARNAWVNGHYYNNLGQRTK